MRSTMLVLALLACTATTASARSWKPWIGAPTAMPVHWLPEYGLRDAPPAWEEDHIDEWEDMEPHHPQQNHGHGGGGGGWGANYAPPDAMPYWEEEVTKDTTVITPQLPENLDDYSHAVSAVVGLVGYTVETFNQKAQKSFVQGIAQALNVPDETVIITDVSPGGRHRRALLQDRSSVNVEFYVLAETAELGDAMVVMIEEAMDNGVMVEMLLEAGLEDLEEITVVEAPEVKTADEVIMEIAMAANSPAFALPALAATLFAMLL